MRMGLKLAGTLLSLAAVGASSPGYAQPATDGLVPYRAVYGVLNDGRRVGEAVHSLSYDPASQHYVFETRVELRGLLRFVSPMPVIERSEFVVREGRIRPLVFTYEDGSRRGRDNIVVEFDWAAGRVIAQTETPPQEWPLPADGLDRASARIALMRDLAAAMQSATYRVADPYELRPLELRREGVETRATALGELRTVRVLHQRPGSSRRSVTWAAPDLHFLAVRIEQQRGDRGPVAFE
ncbi:MAG TPA: DUF3108 domain-containing protein, partial [Gammaproteobacteria bacterium]|nr:DUF3108 domain-containing protein [Gammaproteobacteria bacterium]